MQIYEAACLLTDAEAEPISPGAVAISHGRIADVGPASVVRARHPDTAVRDLGDAILIPGFVNAHQHGRGLSQVQLGYDDDMLEPWIARRRGRGAPDAYALTRLAAAQMLRNGVTATLHANYSYGTGDYEAELRGAIRAYEEAGVRATICVGYADRGGLVYPPADQKAFISTLSEQARRLLVSAQAPYLPLEETLSLMSRLHAEYERCPTISFAYGPAGPQWVSDAAWRLIAADAVRLGVGIHFHLLESPAQKRSMRELYPDGVMARLEALGVFRAKVSVAHFVHAEAHEIAAASRLRVCVVTNPGSNMRLFNGPPPIAAWRAAGLPVALGTDNCSLDDNEDYLSELRLCTLLGRSAGQRRNTQESRDALHTGTREGARAAFLACCGRIALGWRADLTAISLRSARGAYLDADVDPWAAILARGTGADVTMTMVEGRVLHESACDTWPNADSIMVEAAETARASRRRGPRDGAAVEEICEALRIHFG